AGSRGHLQRLALRAPRRRRARPRARGLRAARASGPSRPLGARRARARSRRAARRSARYAKRRTSGTPRPPARAARRFARRLARSRCVPPQAARGRRGRSLALARASARASAPAPACRSAAASSRNPRATRPRAVPVRPVDCVPSPSPRSVASWPLRAARTRRGFAPQRIERRAKLLHRVLRFPVARRRRRELGVELRASRQPGGELFLAFGLRFLGPAQAFPRGGELSRRPLLRVRSLGLLDARLRGRHVGRGSRLV